MAVPAISIKGVTSATSFVLPANAVIQNIVVKNNTANAITGGLKFGTSAGAVDVVVALTVAASAVTNVLDAALLKRFLSDTTATQIFIDAVVGWNSANVDIKIAYGNLA